MIDRETGEVLPFVPQSFRAAGQYDADEVSAETAIGDFDPSKTVQSEAESADINYIVRRFGVTGELPISQRVPLTGDFTEGDVDYRACLDAVRAAEASFNSLPAEVRARFGNDPGKLVEFVQDDANLEEARKLGLIPKAVEPVASGSGQGSGEGGGTT